VGSVDGTTPIGIWILPPLCDWPEDNSLLLRLLDAMFHHQFFKGKSLNDLPFEILRHLALVFLESEDELDEQF